MQLSLAIALCLFCMIAEACSRQTSREQIYPRNAASNALVSRSMQTGLDSQS